MTSLMEAESVSSMMSRSMPMPSPPVGGMPCSSAVRNSSSTSHASRSPASFFAACASKRRRWSSGSVSSEKALASSLPTTKSSKRSVTPVRERCGFASGLTSVGYSSTKVGCTRLLSHLSSKQSESSPPTDVHSAAPWTPASTAAVRATSSPPSCPLSSAKSKAGIASRTSSAMVTRRQGGVRLTSVPWYSSCVLPRTSCAAPETRASVKSIMSSKSAYAW
mmetsp:Transcript_461/g.935  ORF Transcript_461/g.935 Transcript_461/m.935 type:complete len:221 (+) Transcript_461:110-772(+)